MYDLSRWNLRVNKNKFQPTFQPQKGKKIKNSQPQTKFTGSYKKKSAYEGNCVIVTKRGSQSLTVTLISKKNIYMLLTWLMASH